jgi:pimeloyl-ACP methyl ester carboxylesterase
LPLLILCGALALHAQRGGRGAPPIQPKPEELAQVRSKTEQIETEVKELKAKHADSDLVGDVEVYAKAGRYLLEFPELFATQNGIDHSLVVLDQGVDRGKQLLAGQSPGTTGKKQIHAYYSAMDGSVQPYAITLPENYDPAKPARLYVWMHGRQNNTTESEFIFSQQTFRPGNPPVADQGQIQLDLFGRINGAGWHWAGEADVFEAIAAVEKRFKIDDNRVLLRGFSMGGEGAWHVALHHPDRFAAAEIGAGTWSRRSETPGLQPYQYTTLKIWENMEEWALNAFNLPLAAHDGENDNQIASLPGPPPGTPTRGQLESSLRTRAQLEKEGFPAEGDPDYLHMKGTPDIFLISLNTAHGTSPVVRERLDAFLKERGDKGRTSPDHIRFVTYTTRYNRDYWVSVDGLEKHYERADIDATRSDDRSSYEVRTHNISRLTLRETQHAKHISIDGQALRFKETAEMALEKTPRGWTLGGRQSGLHKAHALQGPIDDAFLDPFLLVRPTGTPWNDAVTQQALRTLARFERLWAKYFRGHPFIKDDKDVTDADMAKYHVVLFGDPGSNRLTARVISKLPVKWTKEAVTFAGQSYPAAENFPAMIYPNPLNPSKYVVLNTGLTITDREYNGDYGMPQWGDYAIVKVKEGADVPDLVTAGLFDEHWR